MISKRSYLSLQKRYGGEYVATYKGRVVAHAKKSGLFVKKILHDKRRPHLHVQFVRAPHMICIYGIFSP